LTTDDRPTTNDRPTQGQFTHFAKNQMAITLQRVNRSPSCLVLGGVFRGGGSNGANSGWVKPKIAAGGHFEKLQTT